MDGQQHRPHARLAGRDPRLRQVDEVEVDDEGEQSQQQVPAARAARVGRRQSDRQQQQVRGAEHQSDAPGEFALEGRGRLAQQLARAARGWRQSVDMRLTALSSVRAR